jgi:hypothetical protein
MSYRESVMSVSTSATHRTSNRLFISAKTLSPIRFTAPAVHTALVQVTLDPAVRSLDFVPTVEVSDTAVAVDLAVISCSDGRYRLDVSDGHKMRDIDGEGLFLLALEQLGLPPLTLTREDLDREPYSSNCSLVWANRRVRVHASDRIRSLQLLTEEGSATLSQVAAEMRLSSDPVAAVLALACQDLVEIDLKSSPLGPESVLRRRTPEGDSHG